MSKTRGQQAEHLLDLLCGIILTSPEYIRLGAFGVTQFMDLSLVQVSFCYFVILVAF